MAITEQATALPFVCRFEQTSPDGKPDVSYRDFCAFEFPACVGCSNAFPAIVDASAKQGPLKSIAWCDIRDPVPALHFCTEP